MTVCRIATIEAYAIGQSEVVMGEAIKELGWKRSDVVLSTKIFWVSTANACIAVIICSPGEVA